MHTGIIRIIHIIHKHDAWRSGAAGICSGIGRGTKGGIRLIGQLQTATVEDLTRRFGDVGLWLHRMANADDQSPVEHDRESKGISAETTFEHDIGDFEELESILWEQSERLSARAKAAGLGGRTVTLKLKTKSFRIRTRSISLEEPTQLSEVIFEAGRMLLKREADGEEFRLLGIGLSHLQPESDCDRPQLLDPARTRRAAVERAMDRVRNKFGRTAILKGRSF